MENFSQVTGVSLLTLIHMITTAANNAATHRYNCHQMAAHITMIGNLLEELKLTSDFTNFPTMGEPLDRLGESLSKALGLIDSCGRDKSCLYMLATGWNVVYDFGTAQAEIDQCLKLLPLVYLVDEYQILEIEEDKREYFLDEEDMEAQSAIMKCDRTKKDAKVIEKWLSRLYPDLEFEEALQDEKGKLNIELQQSQDNNDLGKCRVLEHLIEVTEHVVNVPKNKLILNAQTCQQSGYEANAISSFGHIGLRHECLSQTEWQADLFGCFKEPCLSFITCLYPCRTFSWIANVVSKGGTSRESAVHDLMTYSLFCGCCCYTCHVRRQLRMIFSIEGGSWDDFITHLMCCCCAMVQEWRELELRGYEGCQGRKMIPPPFQWMKS